MANREHLLLELIEIEGKLESIEKEIECLFEEQQDMREKRDMLQTQLQSLHDDHVESTHQQSVDWETGHFPWTDDIHSTLSSKFHLNTFRPLQLSCINATLSKHDVILIMPTGGGKSLCYQLPAVVTMGFTLVISPLVSLMEDQLMSVKRLGIHSCMLNASSSREHVNKVLASLIDKKNQSLKLLYVTPEKISKSKRFMAKIEKAYEMGRLSRIVIDEVHCASQWGHDFRPDYKILGIIKRQFPGAPILGLTATATAKVLDDCKSLLNLQTCVVFKASYNRPNLFYEVRHKPSSHKEQVNKIVSLIKDNFLNQSGIIYCFSQKECEQLCVDLCQSGITAGCYHANIKPCDKTHVHVQWTNNKVQVIVATIAFGMGIDKGDVRFVIHHSISKSVENYYQESGRAGRDGQTAVCVIYYRATDLFRQSTMVFTEHTGLHNLYSMVRYCLNESKCRRTLVAFHFGEVWKNTDCQEMCDICQSMSSSSVGSAPASGSTKCLSAPLVEDVTPICIGFLEILEKSHMKDQKLTAHKLVDLWKTSSVAKSEAFSKEKISVKKLERVIVHCILMNVFTEDFHYTPYNTICYITPARKAQLVKAEKLRVTMETTSQSPDKRCRYPNTHFEISPVPLPRSSSPLTVPSTNSKLLPPPLSHSEVQSSHSGVLSSLSKVPCGPSNEMEFSENRDDVGSFSGETLRGESKEEMVIKTSSVKRKRLSILSGFDEIDDDFVINSKTPKRPYKKTMKAGNILLTDKKKSVNSKSKLCFLSEGRISDKGKRRSVNKFVESSSSCEQSPSMSRSDDNSIPFVIEIDSDNSD